MAIVTILREIIRQGARLERQYRYLDPTNKFIRKFVPPGFRNRAFKFKRMADVAITGGIIYESLDNLLDESSTRAKRPSGKFGKNRGAMEQSPYGLRNSGRSYSPRTRRCRPSTRRRSY